MSEEKKMYSQTEMVNALLRVIAGTHNQGPELPDDEYVILHAAIVELAEAREMIEKLHTELRAANQTFLGIGLQAHIHGVDGIQKKAVNAQDRIIKVLEGVQE